MTTLPSNFKQILWWILIFYIIIEICYYAYVRFQLYPKLAELQPSKPHTFNHPQEIMQDIYKLCDSVKHYSFEKFCTGFFLKTDMKHIYTQNIDSFLAWAVYASNIGDLTPEQCAVLYQLRNDAIQRFHLKLTDGYNPAAQHVRFNLEPLHYIHRPFAFYCLLQCINSYYDKYGLIANGFRKFAYGNYTYWYNGDVVESNPKLPTILCFHGICTGWHYYDKIIHKFSHNRRMILFNYDSIKINSMKFDIPELTNEIAEILKLHNIDRISIISHSWGTFLASRVIRLYPDLVVNLTLIDPITLTVILPESTYYLLYKPVESVYDALGYYFVRNDLTISHTVRRNFSWYNCALSLSDIPSNVGVVIDICGKDSLLCVPLVSELVQSFARTRKLQNEAPVISMIWENYEHGTSVMDDNASVELYKAFNLVENKCLEMQSTTTLEQ